MKLKILTDNSQLFLDNHVASVGHYFRNLYQIMKYIDGLGKSSMNITGKAVVGMELRRTLRLYRRQRDYANMLRAQLSSNEVACLFMNCMTTQGHGLRYYVEKYSLLKTLDFTLLSENTDVKQLYSHLAYADFEEMDMDDLIKLIQAKHGAD
nr:putative phage abortive infection protein [Pseudomonas sp. TMW22090]